MTVLTANFETGTNGNSVLVTDTGSANAWDVVTAAVPITYDNTLPAHGSLSAKYDYLHTSGVVMTNGWTTSHGTPAEEYGRLYMKIDSLPGVGKFQSFVTGNSAASPSFTLFVGPTGTIHVASSNAGLGDTTATISTGQWFRVEWHVVFSATVGSVEAKLFNTVESATPTETKTYTSANTLASSAGIFFGITDMADSATHAIYWLDNIVAAAAAYPGPFPVNTTPCTVSGSTPAGSVLTANAGTWNTTFTLTYQWQKDGVNIGGATSSTYISQAGDVGHAIGVVETATGVQATNESAATASSNTVTVTAGGPPSPTGSALPRTRARVKVF